MAVFLTKKHIISRKKPKNLVVDDLALFSHEIEKEIPETFILQLKNVYVLNDSIFSLRKAKFFSAFTYLHKLNTTDHIKRLFLFFKKGKNFDNGIWITDNWSEGYFHWLTDALPRLISSEDFVTSHKVILPESYKSIPFVTESLSFLGYPVHFYNSSERVKVTELLLPSHTAPTGNFNLEVIKRLRNRFIEPTTLLPFRKVFISRQKANKRKIRNEGEIVNLLITHGFEIHFFEDYSFEKQIRIMSETKTLVGLHGAGLTNMLFMQINTQVLELRNKDDYNNNCYFSLASALDIDYYYQLNRGNNKDTHDVEVLVDINSFDKNLTLMALKQDIFSSES